MPRTTNPSEDPTLVNVETINNPEGINYDEKYPPTYDYQLKKSMGLPVCDICKRAPMTNDANEIYCSVAEPQCPNAK